MERLCEALEPLLGPRMSVSAHGGKGVVVQFDGDGGGFVVARAAPWFPGLTERRDLIRTAGNVAHLVHGAVPEAWRDVTGIGPTGPSVTAAGDVLTIRFFAPDGEPLPVVKVALDGQRG